MLNNSSDVPREYAIVDAATATIEDEKVTFFYENEQITGTLSNFGTAAEVKKFANRLGVISFTVEKKRKKNQPQNETAQFKQAINFKPNTHTNKVIKVVLHIQVSFKI